MELFAEMPRLDDGHILLREMTAGDARALAELSDNPDVYRFLPTFLYEQRYSDKSLAIARMRLECFVPHKSVLLAVCALDEPDAMLGIGEIYNYDPCQRKASIGYRLDERYWHRGIATRVAGILTRYIIEQVGLDRVTAHVMVGNEASSRVLLKNGYELEARGLLEDWGRPEPVLVDKYVFVRASCDPADEA